MPLVNTVIIDQLPPTSEGRIVELGQVEGRDPYYVACWNGDEDQTAHWYKPFELLETARQEFESWRAQRAASTGDV